jgi:hypothetical protein
MITLSGSVFNIILKDGTEFLSVAVGYDNATIGSEKMPHIKVTYNVAEDEIKIIKKAYEHLATLCGAKLVSDDLFKN